MTRSHLHGLSSIVLFYLAMILALIEVSIQSVYAGVIFLFLVLAATFGIVYSYCAKCCCKHRCSHVVLGKLTRFAPNRKIERYTKLDYAVLILSFLVVLVYPQFWIWKNIWLSCGFWLLVLYVVYEILCIVCPVCKNIYCPMNRNPDLKQIKELC